MVSGMLFQNGDSPQGFHAKSGTIRSQSSPTLFPSSSRVRTLAKLSYRLSYSNRGLCWRESQSTRADLWAIIDQTDKLS